jgi:uncharacterized membrane protein (UPF0136 family)
MAAIAGDVVGLGFAFAPGAAIVVAGLGLALATRVCTFLLVHKRLRRIGSRPQGFISRLLKSEPPPADEVNREDLALGRN